jgi:hypothetical protein
VSGKYGVAIVLEESDAVRGWHGFAYLDRAVRRQVRYSFGWLDCRYECVGVFREVPGVFDDLFICRFRVWPL